MTTRVIIINPFRLTVEEIQVEADSEGALVAQFHDIVGGYLTLACQIPVGRFFDVCYVDDEGLLKDYDRGFVLQGWGHQIYMGIGIITGVNAAGDTVSARVSIHEVLQRLGWALPMEAQNDH